LLAVLAIADNKSDKVEAANAGQSLVDRDKVQVILGSWGSGLSMAAGPIFMAAKVPAIGLSCTNPLVTKGNPYYFRVCFIDPFQGTVMANYAKKNLNAKKAVIIREVSNDYSVGLAKYFTDSFVKLTGDKGAIVGTLNNCTLSGNSAGSGGGGALSATLNNCVLTGNASALGGGTCYGNLANCTLVANTASSSGGGAAYSATLLNCIVYDNFAPDGTILGVDLRGALLAASWPTERSCRTGGARAPALPQRCILLCHAGGLRSEVRKCPGSIAVVSTRGAQR